MVSGNEFAIAFLHMPSVLEAFVFFWGLGWLVGWFLFCCFVLVGFVCFFLICLFFVCCLWVFFCSMTSSLPICLHQQIVFSSKTPFVARGLLDKLSRQILVMENIAEITTENLGNVASLTDGKREVGGGRYFWRGFVWPCVPAERVAVQTSPSLQEMPA